MCDAFTDAGLLGVLHFPVGPAAPQADCPRWAPLPPTGSAPLPGNPGYNEATFLCSIIQTASEHVHHFACRLFRHEVHVNFLHLPSAKDPGKPP